jgi:hypothetical protein
VTCDEALQLLPDSAMGTLSETEDAAVRHHLRGCGACRADAMTLDRGVAMFASAAHAADPPPELRDRVMSALSEEWAAPDRRATVAAQPTAPPGRRWARSGVVTRILAAAAVVIALGGALAWGIAQHSHASDLSTRLAAVADDASAYHRFLTALGGTEVRVAKLRAASPIEVGGTAILYDSDRHESWSLVEINAPGYRKPIRVTLQSAAGERIDFPFTVELDPDGHGAAWLVTAADISGFKTVRLSGPDGTVLATGVAAEG